MKNLINCIKTLVFCFIIFGTGNLYSQPIEPYKNYELPTDERVSDLISRLTLDEKISLLNYDSEGVERLGIPKYNWWNECLHGVARSGLATVFPQAIGMAAMWDDDMMWEIGNIISDEARAKHHNYIHLGKRGIYEGINFWTPNINIFRDPRWGRGMETYGECPYLTGALAVPFIKGLQGDDPKYIKAVATAKHFAVHSGPESLRHNFNARVSEHDLRNTYLPAFERAVKDAHVGAIMCAYNRFEGDPCCGNNKLLYSILRDEWGFDGHVVTDCWAIRDFWGEDRHNVVQTEVEAAAAAFKNGTDLNCGNHSPFLKEAVEKGLIDEAVLDQSLARVLTTRFKTGNLDPEEVVEYSSIPMSVVDCDYHRQKAIEAAQKSMVLLKNDGILPLSKDIEKIAVIGPNANEPEVLLGNYNGIPSECITPYLGIKNKMKNAEVNYALGCTYAKGFPATFETIPASCFFTNEKKKERGLKVEYFSNSDLKGKPKHSLVDQKLDYFWWDKAPFEDLNEDDFSVKWTGVITVEQTAEYYIGLESSFQSELMLDGVEVAACNNPHHSLKNYSKVKLEAGKLYPIEATFQHTRGDANFRFIWTPVEHDYETEALALINESDVTILCMGISPRLEGEEMNVHVDGFEGGDRIKLALPSHQEKFIKKVKETGKPIVLVNMSGSAIALNWENENLPAIIQAWYPGQAGGTALADILFGDYNPTGRLPITFYKSEKDLPDFEDYGMEGKTYRYFTKEPLYAFGYGLSYSSFKYSKPKVAVNGNEVTVTVRVKNTSKVDGTEVVQLYIHDMESDDPRPIKDLRGFEQVELTAKESKTIEFVLDQKDFAYWNIEKQQYLPTKGKYEVFTGASSANDDLKKVIIDFNK